jgi:glucose/arabinose dehydrogenase
VWWKILLGLIAGLVIGFFVLLSRVDITLGIVFHSLFGSGGGTPTEETLQSRLQLPQGFTIGLYATDVTSARFIEFSNSGDLIVAQPQASKVSILMRDANGDGAADGQRVLLDNLTRPHSIDFHEDYLYIGESNAIGRVRFDHDKGEVMGDYERIITGLGDEGNHWSKSIRFGPDGLLYLSSGSTCNVCIETDQQRATMTRYNPDGTGEERVATGLRNSVGFDWAPFDGGLYATDNGRDLLGNDYPPCELNRIEMGGFYGWPHVNGFGDSDPDFPDDDRLQNAIPPAHGFRAHNAPLGIRFLTDPALPLDYQGSALVALHGSWNRSSYDGYKVVSLHWNGEGFDEKDFLSGFENKGDIIGRPVDIAEGNDGCVYISDDFSMSIFRVCYGIEQAVSSLSEDLPPGETGLEHLEAQALESLIEKGEQLYQTGGCIICHVAKVDKVPSGMKPLIGISARHNVASLESLFETPTPPMPPVLIENDEDRLALTAYLLSL